MAGTTHRLELPVSSDQLRSGVARGVAVLLAVLAVVGALLVSRLAPVTDASSINWVILLAAAWLATAAPLRMRVGGHALDVSVMDAVVGAGLWLLRPDELLLAVLLGSGVHLVLVLRQRGHVLLLNLALVLLHPVVAVTVLALLTTDPDPGRVDLLPALVATLVGTVLTASVVVFLAALDEGAEGLEVTRGVVAANAGVAISAGISGLLAADLLLQGRGGWVLALLPLALSIAVSIAYGSERARASGLQGAIESSRVVHEAIDPAEALRVMAREIATQLDADGAEVWRIPRDNGTPSRLSVGDVRAAATLFPTEDDGDDVAHARLHGRSEFGGRSGWGMSISVAVPDGDTVRVRTLRDPATRRPFTRSDLDLFQRMCRAAIISFETSQMHEALARLRELDEMKTAFLTAVSHDLRTPLAVVLGGVLTVSEHEDRIPDDKRRQLLRRVAVQARRLDQMLSDLLDIDRLERGVVEPNREDVDLTAIVASTIDGLANSTHPVRVSDEPVVGFVDPGHVARIVENLVRNAIKYTPAGTPVWVDVRRDATGAQLLVSDAGPGVPQEQRTAIFGAFVRGDQQSHSPGTGVGLDLVRRLAELHGGKAWVDERPGGGARFWVTLPNSLAAARAAAAGE